MKLEIKKIALIMAAGIFAFSGTFGQEMEKRTSNGQSDIDEVEVINNTANDVDLEASSEDQSNPSAQTTPKSINVKRGQHKHLAFVRGFVNTVRLMNSQGVDSGEIKLELKNINKQEALNKLKARLATRFPNVSIDTKVENKKLVITITKKGEEVKASSTTEMNQSGMNSL